jgi:hypothetical protein
MKLCVDCEHYLPKRSECAMHNTISWVSGETIYTNAHLLRESDSHCGQDAKWFVEKDTSELDDLSTIPFGR